jgi:hypothetical protein
MNTKDVEQAEISLRLLSLAHYLENEGQINLSKLARAAAQSLLVAAARPRPAGFTPAELGPALLQSLEQAAALLGQPEVAQTARVGVDAFQAGRLPLAGEVPNPAVCRTCGYLSLGELAGVCPNCGARFVTFQKFPPIYWLDALQPSQALASLRQTPAQVEAILKHSTEKELSRAPEPGEWSALNILTHMRDSEYVLNHRLGQLLQYEKPVIEAAAVFEWAAKDEGKPAGGRQIFAEYQASRQKTLATLEKLQLEDWQRSGYHQEFGPVTILQQASYFAVHEITHLPHLERVTAQARS